MEKDSTRHDRKAVAISEAQSFVWSVYPQAYIVKNDLGMYFVRSPKDENPYATPWYLSDGNYDEELAWEEAKRLIDLQMMIKFSKEI